jgi:hypothetical protein
LQRAAKFRGVHCASGHLGQEPAQASGTARGLEPDPAGTAPDVTWKVFAYRTAHAGKVDRPSDFGGCQGEKRYGCHGRQHSRFHPCTTTQMCQGSNWPGRHHSPWSYRQRAPTRATGAAAAARDADLPPERRRVKAATARSGAGYSRRVRRWPCRPRLGTMASGRDRSISTPMAPTPKNAADPQDKFSWRKLPAPRRHDSGLCDRRRSLKLNQIHALFSKDQRRRETTRRAG